MSRELVTVDLDRVAVIRLDNPPLNLFTTAMTAALGEALDVVESAGDVRAVVVAAAERCRAFCAGSDIGEFAGLRGRVGEGKLVRENHVFDRLAGLAMPTIAAIEGDAVGGGLELAMCCDLRVASDTARLGLPEVRLGVIPGSGGTQRLPRIVGAGKAREMVLLGELHASGEAERFGLVNRVVPEGRAEAEARRWAAIIATRGPLAVREAKRLLHIAQEVPLETGMDAQLAASERVFDSDDMIEGAMAFREKRAPRFHGR